MMNEIHFLHDLQLFYFKNVLNDSLFLLYLATVTVDIITGNIVALYLRKWNSRTGLNGTLRHIGLFIVVVFLLPMISFTTQIPVITNGVLAYVIAQYTISILENISVLGFDLTDSFGKYFEYLNKDSLEDKQTNKEKK